MTKPDMLTAVRRALGIQAGTGTLVPPAPVGYQDDGPTYDFTNPPETTPMHAPEPTMTNSELYLAKMTEAVATLDTERASLENTLRLKTEQFEADKAALLAAIEDNTKTARAADAFIRNLKPAPIEPHIHGMSPSHLVTPGTLDNNGKPINPFPYGWCPKCAAPGKMREKRPNGNDTCANGHTYPSAAALTTLTIPPPRVNELPDGLTEGDVRG